MKLRAFCDVLEKLAPTRHAAKWDNVGILVESADCIVEKVLLTNDLTPKVMQEAIDFKANLIVAYHPPLFEKFKRISQDNWKDRIVTQALKNSVSTSAKNILKKNFWKVF
jgi:putative NIF3 family GTP cyclohydrolase 1 type 2